MKFNKPTQNKMWRLLLRGVPLIPAPELYDLVRSVKASQDDVDQQVAEAITAIENTSNLVAQLESSLKDRAEKLGELQQEHARYTHLAGIEEDKAKALLDQLESTLGKNVGKERLISFGINMGAGLVIFFLGVMFSEPLKAGWERLTSNQPEQAEQEEAD